MTDRSEYVNKGIGVVGGEFRLSLEQHPSTILCESQPLRRAGRGLTGRVHAYVAREVECRIMDPCLRLGQHAAANIVGLASESDESPVGADSRLVIVAAVSAAGQLVDP